MKVKIEDKKDCQKIIKIEVEPHRVKEAMAEAYNEISKDAQVRGFRKGKAPLSVIQAHYGDTAKDEAIRKLIWSSYRDVVKNNNLKPISYPAVEGLNFKQDGLLSFSIKIDVEPAVNIKAYKNIKIKKFNKQVSDDDISKALEGARETVARFEPVEGRAVEFGDYVVCDYECLVNGVNIDGKKNAWMHIEKNSNLSDISESLIGCLKGHAKEIDFSLPKDFKQAKYAGKKAIYKVVINEIKKKQLPDINDELAKQVGDFKNLSELKDALNRELIFKNQQQGRADTEKQLFDFLLDTNQFDVPETIIQRQLQDLVRGAKMRLMYQGYNKEEIDSQEPSLKEALVINAKKQVKIFFMLDEIARKENITVTPDELDKRIEEMARSSQQDSEKLRKSLKERDLTDSVNQQILHDKVVEFLISNANVKG